LFDRVDLLTYINRRGFLEEKDVFPLRIRADTKMTEEIFPDIYRIEVPLPKSPLKALNAYVIRSRERSLKKCNHKRA